MTFAKPKYAGKFSRALLRDINPLTYFSKQGIILKGTGAWRDAPCCFHKDRHPSLRIKAENGAFRCMACNARGGDILAFHMQKHGLGFIAAAKELNAWVIL